MTIAELARAAKLDWTDAVYAGAVLYSLYAIAVSAGALSPAGDPRCDPFGAQPQAASCQHRIANAGER